MSQSSFIWDQVRNVEFQCFFFLVLLVFLGVEFWNLWFILFWVFLFFLVGEVLVGRVFQSRVFLSVGWVSLVFKFFGFGYGGVCLNIVFWVLFQINRFRIVGWGQGICIYYVFIGCFSLRVIGIFLSSLSVMEKGKISFLFFILCIRFCFCWGQRVLDGGSGVLGFSVVSFVFRSCLVSGLVMGILLQREEGIV